MYLLALLCGACTYCTYSTYLEYLLEYSTYLLHVACSLCMHMQVHPRVIDTSASRTQPSFTSPHLTSFHSVTHSPRGTSRKKKNMTLLRVEYPHLCRTPLKQLGIYTTSRQSVYSTLYSTYLPHTSHITSHNPLFPPLTHPLTQPYSPTHSLTHSLTHITPSYKH